MAQSVRAVLMFMGGFKGYTVNFIQMDGSHWNVIMKKDGVMAFVIHGTETGFLSHGVSIRTDSKAVSSMNGTDMGCWNVMEEIYIIVIMEFLKVSVEMEHYAVLIIINRLAQKQEFLLYGTRTANSVPDLGLNQANQRDMILIGMKMEKW